MMHDSKINPTPELTFGIYPGSGVYVDPDSGAILGYADEPAQINLALAALQAGEKPFLVRGYLHYKGSGRLGHPTPLDMQQYTTAQRKLDLALCYRSLDGDLHDWANCIRTILHEYGPYLAKVQIAEEPNNPDAINGGDGSFLNVRQAIITGVLAAKGEINRLGYPIQVGFNATPSFDPRDPFWVEIGQKGSSEFREALDYVGLDFYPDVFRPLPPGLSLRDAVTGVLTNFRNANLALGQIPARVPIHITENGWPTSATRSFERQALAIEALIRTIAENSQALNITHYEFFDLRDADSAGPGLQFGLLRDDYRPKPAFDVYRKLIEELGTER
jgi:hypothetical protein